VGEERKARMAHPGLLFKKGAPVYWGKGNEPRRKELTMSAERKGQLFHRVEVLSSKKTGNWQGSRRREKRPKTLP